MAIKSVKFYLIAMFSLTRIRIQLYCHYEYRVTKYSLYSEIPKRQSAYSDWLRWEALPDFLSDDPASSGRKPEKLS